VSPVEPTKTSRRTGCAIALIFAFVLVILLVWPAFRSSQLAQRRIQRANQMAHLGLGILSFDDTYHRLPHAVVRDEVGRPLGSRRFRLMPFIEGIMVDCDFNQSWLAAENRLLFCRGKFGWCPAGCPHTDRLHTHYVAVVGPGTPFDEAEFRHLADLDADTILVLDCRSS
jgi:hypothetical protein